MNANIYYWDKAGKENTERTIDAALKRGKELNIEHFVVASCTGATTKTLLEKGKGISIVSVSHQVGFREPGTREMSVEIEEELTQKGVKVYTGTHFFGGVGRAIRMKFGSLEVDELAANTLRILGQGLKVAVEIAVMALDAGLIPYDREIIAIGGTGRGADTAIVCLPRHGKDFFSFEVREIICKPRAVK
ncbi:MAG: hypothetical protein JSU64_04885 [candidate division WOR-3 bacterium]|nr:MAG: hypothetical protein JSU64_04885 [candidate division WOR-3 bacterium]